jgi:hypothetical protein
MKVIVKINKYSWTEGVVKVLSQRRELLAEEPWYKFIEDSVSVDVPDTDTRIILQYNQNRVGCIQEKEVNIKKLNPVDAIPVLSKDTKRSYAPSVWLHSPDVFRFNSFYGCTHPYVLEQVFNFGIRDQILTSVVDITEAYTYKPAIYRPEIRRIEVDNVYFNKGIIYTDQYCTGNLTFSLKTQGNLSQYLSYPKYSPNGVEVLVTKSDGTYQYNYTFSHVKNKNDEFFIESDRSLSEDKELNTNNFDYTNRFFKRELVRGKYVYVRHILDNRSDVLLITKVTVGLGTLSQK